MGNGSSLQTSVPSAVIGPEQLAHAAPRRQTAFVETAIKHGVDTVIIEQLLDNVNRRTMHGSLFVSIDTDMRHIDVHYFFDTVIRVRLEAAGWRVRMRDHEGCGGRGGRLVDVSFDSRYGCTTEWVKCSGCGNVEASKRRRLVKRRPIDVEWNEDMSTVAPKGQRYFAAHFLWGIAVHIEPLCV